MNPLPRARGAALRRTVLSLLLLAAFAPCRAAKANPADLADPAPAPFAALAAKGVTFNALYVNETAGNVSGGLKKGTTVSHYAIVGTDVDLEKSNGWTGAAVHASIVAIKSRGLNAEYIGGGIDTQENYTPFPFVRFANLSLEQKLPLGGGALTLQAGLMGVSNYFARSAYACEFMNHAFCGAIWGLSQDTGSANAPLATWAARASWQYSPYGYVQAGMFMSDAKLASADTHLLDFNHNAFTGRNWLLEAGHETTLADEEKPHYLRLGGWYLDAPRPDVYYNSRGGSYAIDGGVRASIGHGSGAYLTAGKVVARPVPHGPANLAVFGSFLRSFNSAEPLASTAKLGVVATGMLAGREHGALMLGISDTRYSTQLGRFLAERRTARGGSQALHAHEYTAELGYRVQLRPGVVLTPNIQAEIHPTRRSFPDSTGDIGNPLVLGFKLTVDLGRIGGFPRAH
jgi:porin